jgi:hypothetical protein
MRNKFDFEEADAAIQVAEAKDKYEHEIKDYTKVTEVVEDATQKMMDCKDVLKDFPNTMEPVIEKLDKASTIKITEDTKKILESFGKNVYDKLLQMFLTEGTKMIGRMTKERDKVALSYGIFYGVVLSLVILLMFLVVIIVANTEVLHSSILWKYIGWFVAMLIVGNGLAYLITR